MIKNLFLTLFLIILLSSFHFVFSQTDSSIINAEEVIENLLGEPAEEEEDSDLYEAIEYLTRNPIDINSADLMEFQKIPFMDIANAEIIIIHRKKYGFFFSPKELYSVKDISKDLIDKMLPYVAVNKEKKSSIYVEDKPLFQDLLLNTKLNLRSRAINDLQIRKGFKDGDYPGSKYKIYNRMIINNTDSYQLGILTEKDAGENNFNEFTSFHFALKNFSFLNILAAGDYLLEFGQGLALWSPYGFSKSANAIFPVKKKGRNIKPYTSSDENNFFRGAAASINLNSFTFSAFYSKNNFDANIDPQTGEILSTPIDGLHRTENELKRRKIANETFTGGMLEFNLQNISTGILYYNSKFNSPFSPSSVYDTKGDEFNFYSFFYDIYFKNIIFFGEAAYSEISIASINGIQFSINKNFSFVTSFRNYPKNYINIHGFGFGERSGAVQNEVGFYTGIKWRTAIGLINFYYDQFKFPYSTFNNPLPANGQEFLFDLLSKPVRYLETRVRFKYEIKDEAEIIDGNKIVLERTKLSGRGEFIYSISKNLRLKGRFEYKKFILRETGINENGFMFFQDIRFVPYNNLVVYGRVIFFKTDSFNSAIYEYENDLTGVLSNFAMFNEGFRWYLLVRYKLFKFLNFYCKYSETYKPEEKTLGSGNAMIEGNIDNRLSLQLEINF